MDTRRMSLALSRHLELVDMSYVTLTRFLHCASMLKDDILLPQPHTVSVTSAPDILPPSITEFLTKSFDIPHGAVGVLWDTVKDVVWGLPTESEEDDMIEALFQHHGQDRGIAAHVLYPPMLMCLNPDCLAMQRAVPLKKDEPRRVVIFTQTDGVHCTWSVHFKCRLCQTNYHHNYAILEGFRNYCTGLPKYIQVGEHQFVELELAMHWMDLMRIPVSATNCARLYNEAQARRPKLSHDWQFKTSVTTEEVWDAFTILALLDDHQRQNTRLRVPHGSQQSDRYTAAMLARNQRIITHGQDELPHACYGCMRLFSMPDGTTNYTEVVVTDGITVGWPCCGVPHCKNTLASTRHRFCSADPSHKRLETMCAVDGCNTPVICDDDTGKFRKSCGNSLHLKMEDANAALLRSGKSRTQRMKTAKLNDALATYHQWSVGKEYESM